MEMTNVEPRGRISPHCVGLYSDENERALKKIVDFCNRYGSVPIGIQLAHAGRKASTMPPWQGRKILEPIDGGWQPVAPSALAASENTYVPQALSESEIVGLTESFANSAIRADRAGFQAIELHAAHGYLLHQFLSPLSNTRGDRFGGALVNRMRFPLEVFNAVRAEWPDDKPLGVRVSAMDWTPGGWELEDTVKLSERTENSRM